jgi:hypothetical protein
MRVIIDESASAHSSLGYRRCVDCAAGWTNNRFDNDAKRVSILRASLYNHHATQGQ